MIKNNLEQMYSLDKQDVYETFNDEEGYKHTKLFKNNVLRMLSKEGNGEKTSKIFDEFGNLEFLTDDYTIRQYYKTGEVRFKRYTQKKYWTKYFSKDGKIEMVDYNNRVLYEDSKLEVDRLTYLILTGEMPPEESSNDKSS